MKHLIPQPLQFHDHADKQYHLQGPGYIDQICFHGPKSIPFFVISRPTNPATDFTVHLVKQNAVGVDITTTTDMQIVTYDGRDYMYPGTLGIAPAPACGTYHITVNDGLTEYTSNLFNISIEATLDTMVGLSWSDTVPRGGVPYHLMGSPTFSVWFDVKRIGKPTDEVIEERTDNGRESVLQHTRIERLWEMKDHFPHYAIQSINFAGMHDTKQIELPYDSVTEVLDVKEIEVATEHVEPWTAATATVKFRLDINVDSSPCIVDEVLTCLEPDHTVIDAFQNDEQSTVEGLPPSVDDAWLIIGPGVAPSNDWATHINEIATWDGADWVYGVPEDDELIHATDPDAYYVMDSGTANPLNPASVIVAGVGTMNISTLYSRGRYIKVWSRVGAGSWKEEYIGDEDDLITGLDITMVADTYDIRIQFYTHNCDHEYNRIVEVIIS